MSHEHFWSEIDDDGIKECLWCGCKAKDSVDIGITPQEPPRPEGFKPGDLVMLMWASPVFSIGDVARLKYPDNDGAWWATFRGLGNKMVVHHPGCVWCIGMEGPHNFVPLLGVLE